MSHAPIVETARYDPKLKTYLLLISLLWLAISVVGLVLVPVWLIVGRWWSTRYFATLSCVLTERALIIKKGVFFHSETTIPLDSIQDVALHEGPLLRKLGLAQIKIETAGQRAAQGSSEGTLVGITDSVAFRDRILAQRDVLTDRNDEQKHYRSAASSTELLTDIRDSLQRIERHLAQSNSRVSNAL